MATRTGYSLLELLLVLCISALMLGAAVAPFAHVRDVLAVRGARGEVAALFAVARSTAIYAGGATVVVDVGAGSVWIEHRPGVVVGDVHHIADRYGVRLEANRDVLTVRYDALGIGRLSNAVLHVRSGSVSGTLTISAYGRVRQS